MISKAAKKAILIGGMCSLSYLAVYFAKFILGPSVPGMVEAGDFTREATTNMASIYFIVYAVGQLINGYIGNYVPAKYMISIGLFMAGVCHGAFSAAGGALLPSYIAYAASGYFLSMIYGPMTRVVAENTEPIYATRCSLGYTFSSFIGTPLAGLVAAFFIWRITFSLSSGVLMLMGLVCFTVFTAFEKKGLVKYGLYKSTAAKGLEGIRVLIRHKIIKFTCISILTGVIRTTVVYWLSSYANDYLKFSEKDSALIYSVSTFCLSFCTFLAIFVYERLGRDMDKTILLAFCSAALCFFAVYAVKLPLLNIGFLVLAIISSNCAATMMWSRYCPGLRDTGMVSGATGFLDFISYMAASASNKIFDNAVDGIGWANLILVWLGLMVLGIFVALPYDRILKRKTNETTLQN